MLDEIGSALSEHALEDRVDVLEALSGSVSIRPEPGVMPA
jgi:hypothetical protein